MRRLYWGLFVLALNQCVEDGSAVPLRITVPFAIDGTVELSLQGDDDTIAKGDLDADGTVTISIGEIDTTLLARLAALRKREIRSDGAIVAAGPDVRFGAPLVNVKGKSQQSVVISREMLLAWAAAQSNRDQYASWMAAFEAAETCKRQELSGTTVADPHADDTDRADSSREALTAESWAELREGGWQELAAMLSEEAQLQPGSRIHGLSLDHHAVLDHSDGIPDGAVEGRPVELVDRFYLPPTYLREYWPQAICRYADGPKNHTGITCADIRDLLRCMGTEASRLGPAVEPDFDHPKTKITLPVLLDGQTRAVVRGVQSISCTVMDQSGVAAAFFVARDANGNDVTGDLIVNQAPATDTLDDGTSVVTVTGGLLTGRMDDGEFVLYCYGADKWLNNNDAAPAHLPIVIDNSAPIVSVWPASLDGAILSGEVEIGCRCEDTGEVTCELVAPEAVACAEPVQDEAGATILTCTVDTTALVDGNVNLTCAATTPTRTEPTSHSVTAIIDNEEEGEAIIVASLESRIQNGVLTAFEFSENGIGQIISRCGKPGSCVSGADGSVRIPLSDAYRGDILVTLRSRDWSDRASYMSLPTGAQIAIEPDQTLQLILEDYEPGASLAGALNGLTDLHACYVLEAITSMSYEEAKERADRLIGSHFAETPIDFRHAVPPLLYAEEVSTLDDGALSALGHAGVVYAAYQASQELDPETNPVPSYVAWKKLCDDLTPDLRLNGRGRDGTVSLLPGGRLPLDGDFFRYDTAAGLDSFVTRVVESSSDNQEAGPPNNASGISRSDLGCQECTFDKISLDQSALFDPIGETPLRPFDRELPNLVCDKPDGTAIIGSTLPVLECRCDDNQKVSSFGIVSPAEWSDPTLDQDGTTQRVYADGLSVTSVIALDDAAGDIPLDVELSCFDGVGNEGSITVSTIIDRTNPSAVIDPVGTEVSDLYVVTESPVTLSLAASDTLGVSVVRLNGEPVTHLQDDQYQAQMSLAAGEVAEATLEVWDTVSNRGWTTAKLLLVTEPPTVEFASPKAGETFSGTIDLLATITDESGIPIDQVVVEKPPEYGNAAITINGATASVSLLQVSTAPLQAMQANGESPEICISPRNKAGLGLSQCVSGFFVDGSGPVILITSHDATAETIWVASACQTLAGTVADTNGVTQLKIQGTLTQHDENGIWSKEVCGLTPGSNLIEITAKDPLENTSSVELSLSLDDAFDDIEAYLMDAAAETELTEGAPQTGLVTYILVADDARGVDTSTATLTLDGDPEYTAIGDPLVVVHPDDPDRTYVHWSVDAGELLTGVYDLVGSVHDTLGNVGTATDEQGLGVQLVVDHTPPSVALSVAGSVLYMGQHVVRASEITLTAAVSDNSHIREVTIAGVVVSPDSEGRYQHTLTLTEDVTTITAAATDVADNPGSESITVRRALGDVEVVISSPVSDTAYGETFDVIVEATEPHGIGLESCTITAPSDLSGATPTITGDTCRIAMYGVRATAFELDDGTYAPHVAAAARSVANTAGVATVDFAIDTASPTGQIEGLDTSRPLTQTTLDVAVSVSDDTGVAEVRIHGLLAALQDDGLWHRKLTGLTEGANSIEVRAEDTLENEGLVDSRIVDVDTQPPTVSARLWDSTGDDATALDLAHPIRNKVWLVVLADDRSGVAGCNISLSDHSNAAALGSALSIPDCDHTLCVAYEVDTEQLVDGSHQLGVTVRDGQQTPSETTYIPLVVDNGYPSASITAPALTRHANITVGWEASDTVGPITAVSIAVGDDTIDIDNPTNPGSADVALPGSGGIHDIVVYATDDAGHTAPSNTVQVKFDGTRPGVEPEESEFQQRVEIGYEPREVKFDHEAKYNLWGVLETPLNIYRSEFLEGAEGLPVWRFTASDGDSPVMTPADELDVEYQYAIRAADSADWQIIVSWSAVESGYSTYTVAASAESLTTAPLDVGPDAEHRLQFRSRDAAGNFSDVRSTVFRLNIDITPVIMSGCGPHGDITGVSLRNRTVHERYRGLDEGVMHAEIYWPLQAAPSSPVSDEAASIILRGGAARTTIAEVTYDVERAGWPAADELCSGPHDPSSFCEGVMWASTVLGLCGEPGCRFAWWPEGRPEECVCRRRFFGPYLTNTSDDCRVCFPGLGCSNNPICAANSWQHQTKYHDNTSNETRQPGQPFAIGPDTVYAIDSIAVESEIDFGGVVFEWPEQQSERAASYAYDDGRELVEAKMNHVTFPSGTEGCGCDGRRMSDYCIFCTHTVREWHYISEMRLIVSALSGTASHPTTGRPIRIERTDDCKVNYRHHWAINSSWTEEF